MIGIGLTGLWLAMELVFLAAISNAIKNAHAIPDFQGITVRGAAEEMLKLYHLQNVTIRDSGGSETPASDPLTIYLSKTGQRSHSVSVLAVTVHEVGRAVSFHKGSVLYHLSLFLTKFSRFALFAAIPGVLIGLIGKVTLLTTLCVWIYGISGFFTLIMHAADREASRYAETYLKKAGFLDDEQIEACLHMMHINDWSYIQYIFEPFFLIVIFLYSLLVRIVKKKPQQEC